MSDAVRWGCDDERILTAAAALAAGEIWQLPDGRAGVYTGANAAAIGDDVGFETEGIFTVQKTASIVLLDGGPVYWDHSANKAHFKKVNDRDFFLGTVVGDAASADTTVKVNLNVQPVYLIDCARDPIDSVVVLTAGTPQLRRIGGAQSLEFDATAEAQKVDILSKDGFAPGANAIVEFAIEVVDDGDAAAIDGSFGVANGTHASDADAITESCFIHLDGNDTQINAESDDGSTEVAATDTTKDYVLGTRFEVWMDFRDPSDVQIYVDAVLVLGATTFDISAATGPLHLLAHLEKTADNTTAEYHVEWLRARIAEQ